MDIKIDAKNYKIYQSPLLGGKFVFQYKLEDSISMIVGIMNNDILYDKFRFYYYGKIVPIIKNRDLINHYRARNPETGLLEMDLTKIAGTEPFIIDLSYDSISSKFLIIDIDAYESIPNPTDVSNPIGTKYRIKLRKMEYFRMKLEEYAALNNKHDAIALMHDLLEQIISDLCRRNQNIPTTNFKHNLGITPIVHEQEKAIVLAIKYLTGVFAHGNTSTLADKNELAYYYDSIRYFIENLLHKYYR